MKKILYKSPSDSETIKTEGVCPNDTNPMGLLQGGRLVEWMDIAGAVCSQTHAEKKQFEEVSKRKKKRVLADKKSV